MHEHDVSRVTIVMCVATETWGNRSLLGCLMTKGLYSIHLVKDILHIAYICSLPGVERTIV